MIVYPDPNNAPLRDVPVAMRERRTHEFLSQLAETGIQFLGGDDHAVILNLRNLAAKNGSIERGQAALYAALETLRAVRLDCEVSDIGYILGNTFVSHAIARGLESNVPQIVLLLTSIQPDELFNNLEQASAFVFQDRHENEQVQERLKAGAGRDLFAHGLLDSPDESYRDGLHWEDAAPRPLPREFEQDLTPWRSPFDLDGEF